jgi:hypothetical protein
MKNLFCFTTTATSTLALTLALTLTFFTTPSVASNYPADMEFNTSCQERGPVKVCRGMQGGGYTSLHIYYKGALLKASGLKAYVQVNYLDGIRSGLFNMDPLYPAPYDTQATVRITGGCLVGKLGGCVTSGTQEMRDLLFWAQNHMILNALDLEVAFVSDSQELGWDNQGGFGINYKFSFPQM